MGHDWRWWFRRDCRAIAAWSSVRLSDQESIATVILCHRWRWHKGPCDGLVANQVRRHDH